MTTKPTKYGLQGYVTPESLWAWLLGADEPTEPPKCEACGEEYEASREVDRNGDVTSWTQSCECKHFTRTA